MKTVLKLLLAVCIIAVGSPAFALFTNGGFENGNFTGWTVTPGSNHSGTFVAGNYPTNYPDTSYGNTFYGPNVINSSRVPDSVHYPYIPSIYNDTYMAVLNDANWGYDATRIKQTGTVTAADVLAGGSLSVNWGAVLDDPGHAPADQPKFDIEVLDGTTVIASFSANATDAATAGSGWTKVGTYAQSGDQLWYKAGQFLLPMSTFALNDQVTIQLTVFDCALGGHGGYAFLDGIQSGTPPPPPPGVPEPATMLLLGFGVVGLAGLRRRFTK